jgi:predicted ATPase
MSVSQVSHLCADFSAMAPIQPPRGYVLGKRLHTSTQGEVYAATRESDGRSVVLKTYTLDATFGASSVQSEFDALRRVSGPGIPAALDLAQGVDSRPVLVLERAPGIKLAAWVEHALPTADAFLEVSIQLVEALARVHTVRLLHRDINPNNVLVDPASRECWLIDFGLARPLGAAVQLGGAGPEAERLQGTLRYISPEQSGRMNRGVDTRSDLYSLGATFYFMLTGRPPFESEDPLALIHAHMAKVPPAPIELRPMLPATLSRIVVKLLQKSPEARYQTANALRIDLTECRIQLQRAGTIQDDFPLGTADAPYRPLFPKNLYGRESEIRTLVDAYSRAAAGRCVVLLLQGPPGIGKSALVHELRVPLAQSGGYFARGKFDQYRRDVPYLGLVQAFQSLAQQVLTESDARLEQWRTELGAVLGQSAGVLVELVPDLRLVLGEVAPVAALGPAETRARLSLAVQRFVHGFAAPGHPLVLFLDDLQWADAGSRDLLAELLPHVCERALLVLGSYRDSEVVAGHPLVPWMRAVREHGSEIERIALQPLDESASAQMLADALGRTEHETRSLAACVGRKTGNAPLLIQQFVYHMYDLGLIRFESPRGWTWEEAALVAADIPDDAVGLMTAKIGRLSSAVTQVLQLASCVGDGFELDSLVELTEYPTGELESALYTLCDEGLIAPGGAGFRFVHDRVREAAQALLSEEQRAHLHHQAALLLLEHTSPDALPYRAAEIADHLNLASSLDGAEQVRALQINVLAGQRALRAGAAATAAHYLTAGRRLFRDSHWQSHPQLGFELLMESAEAAYQMREEDLALQLLSILETRPLSPMQSAMVAAKAILTRSLNGNENSILPFVLDVLRRFGVRWPPYPSRLRTRLALLRTQWVLRGALDERLFTPAGAGDHSGWFAPLVVMAASGPALTGKTVRLICLLTCHVLSAYRKHGYLSGPAFALAGYASHRVGFLRHARGADRYAQAALEWNARSPHPFYSARTEFVVYSYLYSWTRPRRSILDPLRRAANQCREAGDLGYLTYALNQRVLMAALAGEPLARLVVEIEEGRTMQAMADTCLDLHATIIDLLVGPHDDALVQERSREIRERLCKHPVARMGPWVFWLETLCLLGRYPEALATAQDIAEWIRDVGCMSSQVVDFAFFRGIAAAELASGARGSDRRQRVRLLRNCLREVRVWSHHGPDFVHMVLALQAELERLRHRPRLALARYGQAIEHATQQGYGHHAALLHERRAQLLLTLRRTTETVATLRRAISLYEAWGSSGKAAALQFQLATLSPGTQS